MTQDPMVFLLLGTAALYWLLGDSLDALFLTSAVGVLFLITALQERRATRALRALKKLAQPQVRVLREGAVLALPASKLRLSDHLLLQEGERVAADGELLEAVSLAVDESLLTGESVPVWSERGRMLRAGTFITQGKGLLRVDALGAQTQAGKIGTEILEELKHPLRPTPGQLELQTIARKVGVAAVILSALIFGVLLLRGNTWTEAVLLALAAGISLIPVEFSLVSLITLALGAERLTRSNILVRHARAIEALGSLNVLALDKTGTLTENRMALREVLAVQHHPKAAAVRVHRWTQSDRRPPHGAIRRVLEYAELASHREPFDPLELAIQAAVHGTCPWIREPHRDRVLLKEYPIEAKLRAMTCVWLEAPGVVLATKGAPEAIFELCHLDLNHPRASLLQARLHQLTDAGFRVLGVARGIGRHQALSPQEERYFSHPAHLRTDEDLQRYLPKHAHDFTFEFLGLLALEDPIRPTVPETLRRCDKLGVSVVMLTGDHPRTALAIAKKAGFPLHTPHSGLGRNVLARVSPEEKLHWVRERMREGYRVGMTGDGVNDAPSLSAAHVGVAMGSRATEVAREAASIILLDDRFESLVTGILEGRRISANLRLAAQFILAVHALVGVLAVGPPLLGWPILFRPAEIVFIEFVMDPSAALIFPTLPLSSTDPERPRPWSRAILGGLTMGLILLGTYAWNLSAAESPEMRQAARGSAFQGILLAIALLVLLTLPGRLRESWVPSSLLLLAVALAYGAIREFPVLRHVLDWVDPSARVSLRSLLPLVLGFWILKKLRMDFRR